MYGFVLVVALSEVRRVFSPNDLEYDVAVCLRDGPDGPSSLIQTLDLYHSHEDRRWDYHPKAMNGSITTALVTLLEHGFVKPQKQVL